MINHYSSFSCWLTVWKTPRDQNGPMKHDKPFEINDIKNFAKDADAQARLEGAFQSQADQIAILKHQLDLLESAIRNDYDSIIITELSLEKPGPRIV